MITRISIYVVALALLMSVLPGCGQAPKESKPAPSLVGADRDKHGCIGSAGFTWCSREASCVRPWELSQQKGFANSVEAFEKYCSSISP